MEHPFKIEFEWDEYKNQSNQKKHDVSFSEAKSVFYDENSVQFFDEEHSDSEDRFLMLGMSLNQRILLISHCVRELHIIRIISARRATKKESRLYKGNWS